MLNSSAFDCGEPDVGLPDLELELRVAQRTAELSRALAVVEAQKRELEEALRVRDESQRQLEAELSDARLLHGVSAMLIDENSIGELYQRLVEAATLIMRSDFGSLQRFDAQRGELQMIANVGLDDEATAFWQWVYPGRATTCGRALDLGARVIVPDFETCAFIAGSEDLVAFRKADVRSAQSTPLLTRNGRLVGMITTHWTHCHQPPERDLRLLDIVARQAADLIERNTSADALRCHASRLVEADRYKNEFLATLAHELRNPLAPIQTGLSILRLGKPEQAPRILTMMERQLGHMVRLIDDLLDVSRISRGMVTLKRARIALDAVIHSAIETSRPLITAARHQFTLTLPDEAVWLDADLTRLAQIVSNLLNNAAKYTPPGGRIDLAAHIAGGDVLIRVSDTGIGIAPAMQSSIFELFTQVDAGMERSQGGLGVGLALAKQLAEMHAGGIEVASPRPGGGSVFTLRLPLAAGLADDGAGPGQGSAATPAGALRILVVDDNADAAHMLALLLDQLGHASQVVLDAREAVAAALAFRPDLMFLDLGMPHLNGFDLARDLRTHAALQHVCLAALSGWGTDQDRARSRHAGMAHHLTKPVMLADVSALLSQVAQRP